MGMKLNRGRHKVFGKKKTGLRTALWALACVVIIAAGFFGAKLLDSPPPTDNPASSDRVPESEPDTSTPQPSVPEQPAITQPDSPDTLRAFYLPFSALRDTAGLSATLQQAKAAGFNSVVFDLKDNAGNLYYRFDSQMARQVNSYTADALTTEELTKLFATLRQAGIEPLPRLYAFRDNLGAKALPAARITPQGNNSWTWYDNDPNNGGKAWLNPYADEAHSYIIGLAQELQAVGATAILLDGVQFPHQISSASFGSSSNTALNRGQVLTLFVDKVKTALDGCKVILSCTAQGALGTDTGVYGNNPLTFAPTVAAPTILPGSLPASIRIGDSTIQNAPDTLQQTVQALVSQMVLRTKVMEADKQPTLLPWLQAEGYTAAQIKQEIAGCIAADVQQYILYHPAGLYDFSTLTQ
ncbi:MAG: hypothetical protein IJ518_07990 [Clostridia bacterium]|nr:hypothetical protein [Clostridia bacterium]